MEVDKLKRILKREIKEYIENEIEFNVRVEESSTKSQTDSVIRSLESAIERLKMLTYLNDEVNEMSQSNGRIKNAISRVIHEPRYFNEESISFAKDLVIELLFADQNLSTNSVLMAMKEVIQETIEEINPFEKTLPQVFTSARALEILKKAVEENYLDENFKPICSKTVASILATHIGKLLHIDESQKWKPFAELWDMKDLANSYQKALCQKSYESNLKKIQNCIY